MSGTTTKTGPDGTEYEFDARDRLVHTTRLSGEEWTYGCDARGNPVRTTWPDGTIWEREET